MAKVYLSSTLLDLKPEREAVTRWLVAAGHLPVHSYVADSESVHVSCLKDIDPCDLYVLILGHRYGFVPAEGNPGQLAITQLEFRHAGELGLPRIALLRTSVPDINLSDLLDPSRIAKLQDFREEVGQALRPAEFADEAGLIHALSAGVQRTLVATAAASGPPSAVRSQLNSRIAQLASQFEGFGGLANALNSQPTLSEQAISILRQLVESGAECFMEHKMFTGEPDEYLLIGGAAGKIKYADNRFIKDDLDSLVSASLVRLEFASKGSKKFFVTRAAVEFFK